MPAVIKGQCAQSANCVVHPAHYNAGHIEVWDAIADWDLDFDCGNVVKYIARAGKRVTRWKI